MLHPDRAGLTPVRTENGGSLMARVLIVDDDAGSRHVMSEICKDLDLPATSLPSAAACLAYLDDSPEFDGLLLVDIHMPRMSGAELLRALRADSLRRSLPVIAVSADIGWHDDDRCSAEGFDGLLRKPVRFDAVREMIGRHAAGRGTD